MLITRFKVDDVNLFDRFCGHSDFFSDIASVSSRTPHWGASQFAFVEGMTMAKGTVKWFNTIKGYGLSLIHI